MQIFTAMVDTNDPLIQTLEWRVTDPVLGNIVESRGFSAVYRRNNIIIVQDQSGKEGLATVIQP